MEFVMRFRNGPFLIFDQQMKPMCSTCFKVKALRRGLVRNIQPGRITVYEKNQPQAQRQWLFGGLANSTLWNSTHLNGGLQRDRPKSCS